MLRRISAREAAVAERFVVSVLLGAAIALALWVAYPNELRVSTDIVGYPIFANFNVRKYLVEYLLAVVVFPILSIGFYSVLARWSAGRSEPRTPLLPAREAAEPTLVTPSEEGGLAGGVARAAFVGAVWASVAGIAFGRGLDWIPLILAPGTGLYVAAVLLVARRAVSGTSGELGAALARVNAIAASFLLVGIVVASEAAQVTVVQTGQVDRYPFVPELAGLVVALAAGVLVARAVWRTGAARSAAAERRVLLLLAGPVALFLLLARLPGALPSIDLFETGILLEGGNLLADGRFPWRDFLFTHGLLNDAIYPLYEMTPFQDSVWGQYAGTLVLGTPTFWITNYFLCVYLFGRNWLFLLGSQLLVVLEWPLGSEIRFVLLPLVLLLLAALLHRPTWPRAAGLMLAGLAQAVLAPETIPYAIAAWLVVVVYELAHRSPGSPLAVSFARTIRCAAAGAVALVAFVAWLAANDALGGFVDWYPTFVGGHDLTGGFPIQWKPAIDFHFWVYAPLVAILAAWWFAAARIGSGRWFTIRDWVVGASVLGLVAYYTKFTGRADVGHLFQVATAALIPLLYVAYRLVDAVDSRIHALGYVRAVQHPITAALVLIVIVLAPHGPWALARDLPDRLTAAVSREPRIQRLGYSADPLAPTLLPDMRAIVAAYAGPNGKVFDFTNSPALFGYFVQTNVPTRYYHVSMAIPERAQSDLVSELRRERPPLVVYSGDPDLGLPAWDQISNPVRHYLVSNYLLDNYRPAIRANGYMFMVRDDLPAKPPRSLLSRLSDSPSTDGLYFAGQSCDWGYAPEFLDVDRPPAGQATDVRLRPAGPTLDVRGWAVESGLRPARAVLAVLGDRVIGELPVGEPRPDVAAAVGSPRAESSGFSAAGWKPPIGSAPINRLRFFALARHGTAAEIPGTAAEGPRVSELRRDREKPIPVRPKPAKGSVDALSISRRGTYRLEVPPNARGYNWLELRSAEPFPVEHFTLRDAGLDPTHAIDFSTLAGRSRSVRVLVGACPQWHGYRARSLTLTVDPAPPPLRARLLR